MIYHKKSVHEVIKFDCNISDYESNRPDGLKAHILLLLNSPIQEISRDWKILFCQRVFLHKLHICIIYFVRVPSIENTRSDIRDTSNSQTAHRQV